MNRPAHIGLTLLGALVALALLTYAGLFLLVRSPSFRGWAQAELSRRTGLQIRFAELTMHLPMQLAAKSLEVSRPGAFALESARIDLTLAPLDLWFHTVYRVRAEQPRLTIDLLEIMKASAAAPAGMAIRHLKLQDGSLILKKGDATVLHLPNIHLEARDLNVGPALGIRLHADVPSLDGETELHVAGAASALTADIALRPRRAAAVVGKHKDWLRLRAHLELPREQPAKGTITGTIENLPVRAARITGDVALQATTDQGWEEVLFSGRAAIGSIGAALGPIGKNFPEGGAVAELAGSFSLSDMTLAIESAEIDSPFGTGAGAAVASFAAGPTIKTATLSWSGFPLSTLEPMLAPAMSAWNFDGSTEVTLHARGPWNDLTLRGEARSEKATLQGGAWSLGNATFALPFAWSGGAGRVEEAQIVAARLAFVADKIWQASAGRARAVATMSFSDRGSLKIAGTIEASGGNFQSVDGTKIGENLSVRGPVTISTSGNDLADISADLLVESGEILWNKLFVDLKMSRPRISFDGEYAGAADRLEFGRAEVALTDVGTVHLTGLIDQLGETPQFHIQARSEKFQPGAFFETFLRENLKRQYPFFDTLLLGGTMAFQVRLTGSGENLALAGDLSVLGGAMKSRSGSWEITGIALKLPFAAAWGNSTNTGEESRPGSLAVGAVRFAGHEVRLSPAIVTLFQNELRFAEPLRVGVFGGEIVIGDLRWPDLIRRPREMTFSLTADRLQLADLTDALDWPRFRGTLTGSIPQIESNGTILRTNGEIRAEVFGGRVRISKLEIENPFSALAAIRLDAALANVDLEQLSRTFAFGRISGTLEGTVADLIIIDGQPAQFGVDLHSVDRGGEQRISVEALNKITVLSSGQSAGTLYGGLAGLFDSFRYSKLGFKAILRNDRLVLRGVESRGDQEYLVVGSVLPPTVNIVSHTQTIGFSELLRRLERIQTEQPKVQ